MLFFERMPMNLKASGRGKVLVLILLFPEREAEEQSNNILRLNLTKN